MEAPFGKIQKTGPNNNNKILNAVVIASFPCMIDISQGVINCPMSFLDSSAYIKILKVKEESLIVAFEFLEQFSPHHRKTAGNILDIDRFGQIFVQHKVLIDNWFQLLLKKMSPYKSAVYRCPFAQHLYFP